MNVKALTRAAVVGALYVVLVVVFAPISFMAVQVRIASCLSVLGPWFYPETVVGLALANMVANTVGGLGIADIVGGFFIRLLAGTGVRLVKRYTGNVWLAPVPNVLVTSLIVASYVAPLVGMPYWLCACYVGAGEAIANYALGVPLTIAWGRRRRAHAG